MKRIPNKIYLSEKETPKFWYNIAADLPNPPPPPLGKDGKPCPPEQLAALFPIELLKQEMSRERYIEIPKKVREAYMTYRPSPLNRAYRLEKALGTPARIYYKYEGNNPSGSHKLNTAIPQAYYNKAEGIKKLTTETGAGQWGTALAAACAMFGIEDVTYMVKASAQQKPYRKIIMETFGAQVHASPSDTTEFGRGVLAKDPGCRGSLGTAISEAVELALKSEKAHYSLGSVLNHVVLHQTVIGEEALLQFAKIDDYPDIVIACVGGGSNFGGLAFPFIGKTLREGVRTRYVAVEPSACPTLTRGKYAYDYGDMGGFTPALMQYTLGSGFIPSGIHAGGLRYHGASGLVSVLKHENRIEAVALSQTDVFGAAVKFAEIEGLLPAPESAHAICAAMSEALACKESGEAKTILFNLTGHGYFDLAAYDEYNKGNITDAAYSDEELKNGLASLPDFK
ncbi:MAG: TrpB-like pyridoxal phosphate-dependent enzyme [Clostridiales bacterium]|jgi:tryptophan synthase beta chain|nr:TrpB-like pyridoxal phosphate-dependent enzyme [Clostridiales bacterium]